MRKPHARSTWLQRIWLRLALAGLACCLTSQLLPSQPPTIVNRAPATLGPPELHPPLAVLEFASSEPLLPKPPDTLIFLQGKTAPFILEFEPVKRLLINITSVRVAEPIEAPARILPSDAIFEITVLPHLPELMPSTPPLRLPEYHVFAAEFLERPAFGDVIGVDLPEIAPLPEETPAPAVWVAEPKFNVPPLRMVNPNLKARFDGRASASDEIPIDHGVMPSGIVKAPEIQQMFSVESEDVYNARQQREEREQRNPFGDPGRMTAYPQRCRVVYTNNTATNNIVPRRRLVDRFGDAMTWPWRCLSDLCW